MEENIHRLLISESARKLLGFDQKITSENQTSVFTIKTWTNIFTENVAQWPNPPELYHIGSAALSAFLQSNVTGPPLSWHPTKDLYPPALIEDDGISPIEVQRHLISCLSVDGEAIYQLTPNAELFYFATRILNGIPVDEHPSARLARLHVNFWHQQLLTGISPTLQNLIYTDLEVLSDAILKHGLFVEVIDAASFLVQRATIHMHHGFDAKARDDLETAAKERSFCYALTGRLGKRTKFQEKEISQLIVLAKSALPQQAKDNVEISGLSLNKVAPKDASKPRIVDLNDDTLLESISFSRGSDDNTKADEADELPQILQSLDPGNQPLLDPLDSIILLGMASSITNTTPADGLTREGTLPYAERVIAGGSSNWQVHTQALLVRSRIEGYRSRTIERGVLQLQALVDQVIAETSPDDLTMASDGIDDPPAVTSFLPKPTSGESAPLSERLKYIHQLASPPRWKLEAELADRWVSLGGLRTALEIYERLQMWAEVALCWAANDREDKARLIIRQQLYNSSNKDSSKELINENEDDIADDYDTEKDPLPADAPRLFCILGDIESSATAYERAWEVSNHRYARAQRSLGKLYMSANDYAKADEAYAKSLRVDPQNHPTWFTLGCVRLQTEDWAGAIDAFGRAVQIEDTDAESWSNLAVALLRLPVMEPRHVNDDNVSHRTGSPDHEEQSPGSLATDPQKHVREAFIALKRASSLKRDSFRIWQNILSVSVRLSPPPYNDMIMAQTRLIDLKGKLEGEKCVDVEIVEALVAHMITTSQMSSDLSEADESLTDDRPRRRSAFEKMVIDLVQKKITPLITSSRRLWLLVAKLSIYLKRPFEALSTYEKAWRVALNQPSWDSGDGIAAAKATWRDVVDSTIDLLDAYESLGEKPRESGLASGELVAKDWKFKSRSALRSVIARTKGAWEGDEGFERLSERLQDLKTT